MQGPDVRGNKAGDDDGKDATPQGAEEHPQADPPPPPRELDFASPLLPNADPPAPAKASTNPQLPPDLVQKVKRATVYFVLGEYVKSLADCDEVMARNPYHWGALSGYGMIYAEMDQPSRAVEYFEKALAVNPNLTSVQQAIETLKALLLQRRREMI